MNIWFFLIADSMLSEVHWVDRSLFDLHDFCLINGFLLTLNYVL